jgi:tRNA dimethylallyltransferase
MDHRLNTTKTLIVIAGPTAVGKTAVSVKLAQELRTEIVSADSRQFYREMSIGTAKPNDEEMGAVKHHFISSNSITEKFSVGDYEKQCLQLLDELFEIHHTVILVGGSGLFIQAITKGFDDLPVADTAIREQLNAELAEKGIQFLQERLKSADPDYYTQVDLHNPQRLIRALEVFGSTGKPFSYYRKATIQTRPFRVIEIGLDLPREILYDRINRRVEIMINEGLVEEVRSLLPYRHLNALNTVGYSELFNYLDGKTDLDTAIALIKQNTRRFAKRQLTWFRKDNEIKWLMADRPDLIDTIQKEMLLKQIF